MDGDTTPMVSKEISDYGLEARNDSTANRLADYSQGNAAARGLMSAPDNYNQDLGYSSPMQSAIKSKYSGQFEQGQKRLKLNTLRAADEDHLRKVQIANEMANEEMRINQQKEQLKRMKKLASRQARGQLIGSVLGVVGAVGGAVAGTSMGGPAGGIAGAMAGQGIGQGAGGMIGGG